MKKYIKLFCMIMSFVLILTACGGGGNIMGRNAEESTYILTTETPYTGMPDVNGETDITGESSLSVSPEPVTEDILAPTAENENEKQMIITGTNTGTDKTLTGFEPLETVKYTVNDPKNSRGLSVKTVCHSHGPASGGKPHHTVVGFQKHFDEYNAVTLDTKSEEKVLYLTFDCGYEHDSLTARVLDVLKEKNVPAAFFCTLHHIKDQPELIKRMILEGHIVGNHSTNHPSFAEINREKMATEIEECENYLRENFGYCAKYFRFPKGEYTDNALDLVNSLGYVSVFWSVAYSDWDVNDVKGADYAVKTVMERLHPGAVILLHSVSKDNADALGEIIDKARAEGYVFKQLNF